jgi:hypothetical protein
MCRLVVICGIEPIVGKPNFFAGVGEKDLHIEPPGTRHTGIALDNSNSHSVFSPHHIVYAEIVFNDQELDPFVNSTSI